MMSEVGYSFYPEPPKSDYSDSVEGAFTIDATGSEDTFGLEFAVSQWLKLVTNAENLFSKLVTSKFLSDDEKTQIERWLCLKQECEECVASDDAASLRGCNARVLERIDELTESDLKTEKSSDIGRQSPGDNSFENESDTESDLEQNPDFVEKLDRYMSKLRARTDEKIDHLNTNLMTHVQKKRMTSAYVEDGAGAESKKGTQDVKNPQYGRSNLPRRRKSIHPGTEAESVVNQLNFKTLHEKTNAHCGSSDENASSNLKNKSTNNDQSSQEKREEEATALPYIPYLQDVKPGPSEELRMLSAGNEAKQSQMCQVLIDLEGAQRRIEELQRTIQLKEQFIENMVKNDKMRATAKQRFRRKRIKLESEYYKTRTLIAQAENNLMIAHENNLKDDEVKCQREIERFKSEAILYEKRLKNIEIMKQIAENSARKMLELENSLQKSRCQMDRLKKQLKKEEEYKHMLEQELLQDQCKIRELEEKYMFSVQHAKDKTSKKAECRLKWIQEEEERVLSMRESSQRFQEQLIQKQIMLERREAFLKQRLCLEKSKTKNISEVSARISQLHQVLKEKSADCERIDYEKEALRHEIGNLRRTRDCLVDQRCNLDEKFQKKTLSNVEERKLIECEEAIEAIDAAIEYKNELICGRNAQELNSSEVPREKGEELLLARLMQLSPMELRSLLYKYFKKVIDLRESGKKMEIQLSELDIQNESQKWKIQALSNALQQAHLKAERHIVMLQKEHEEEMALMLRYFAEESSGSSGPEVPEKSTKPPKPQHRGCWKNGPSTTVTKENGKLIFQQQKARKTPKR
ncbi:hypothetical protein R5R35_003850 [Gryllus longicercus]|uniref:Uncharacterized protein n=1 Tax=Gryllus longicercus TaxID=2509291 RepID=A0AAN9VNU8_9ORTH